jgi:hypothetical protein
MHGRIRRSFDEKGGKGKLKNFSFISHPYFSIGIVKKFNFPREKFSKSFGNRLKDSQGEIILEGKINF